MVASCATMVCRAVRSAEAVDGAATAHAARSLKKSGVSPTHGFEEKDFRSLDCGLFLKGLRIFNGRFIGGFVGSFLGDALRCRCRDIAKRSVALVGRAFALTFELALILVVLRHKNWFGSSPCFVHGLIPVIDFLGFKNVAEIHLRQKVIN